MKIIYLLQMDIVGLRQPLCANTLIKKRKGVSINGYLFLKR